MRELVRPGVEVVKVRSTASIWRTGGWRFDAEAPGYDYLVVALGAELAPDAIPGLASGAHTFYTLDGSARLRSGP